MAVLVLALFSAYPAHATGGAVNFAGYVWNVKDGFMGPGGNYWNPDPSAVFVDAMGQLHLKITNRGGRWYSSEVWLPSSLGYGVYEFDVASPVHLNDPNTVAAAFLYADDTHELDIEFTNWQNATATNAQYVIQPFPPSSNLHRFNLALAPSVSTHLIIWSPDAVRFASFQNGSVLQEWEYHGPNNFAPGAERVHINFWMINHMPPSDLTEKKYVISGFRYSPLTSNPVNSLSQQPEVNYQSGPSAPQNVNSFYQTAPFASPSIAPSTPTVKNPAYSGWYNNPKDPYSNPLINPVVNPARDKFVLPSSASKRQRQEINRPRKR